MVAMEEENHPPSADGTLLTDWRELHVNAYGVAHSLHVCERGQGRERKIPSLLSQKEVAPQSRWIPPNHGLKNLRKKVH